MANALVIIRASDVIQPLADEAECQGADSSDSCGIVRALVAVNLPGSTDEQFSAWFCVCCELANRSARAEGYYDSVERAWTLAHRRVSA